jgi:hypothetical protein
MSMKSRKWTPRFVFAGLIAIPACNPAAYAQGQGSICLVPGSFDEFSKGGATVEAYAAHQRESEPDARPESVRYVRVDRLPPAKVTSLKSGKITGIAITGRHVVTISKQSDMAQPLARFHFSFREQKSGRLCLWYETFYGTWRLQAQSGEVCRCD